LILAEASLLGRMKKFLAEHLNNTIRGQIKQKIDQYNALD